MSERKVPVGFTLAAMIGICSAVWLITLLFPLYVGAAVLTVAIVCAVLWLVMVVRRAFTFAERDLADFTRGKQYKPLTIDPEYAALQREIDKARAKHLPVKHLLVKQSARVHEMLGAK